MIVPWHKRSRWNVKANYVYRAYKPIINILQDATEGDKGVLKGHKTIKPPMQIVEKVPTRKYSRMRTADKVAHMAKATKLTQRRSLIQNTMAKQM